MTYQWMTWLPGVLRAAGVAVSEVDGWQARGHAGDLDREFTPCAVLVHHDGSAAGPTPGEWVYLRDGFDSDVDNHFDAQSWVDRNGVWHVIAAGRAQHAGAGIGWGAIPANLGNQFSLGVETDHTTGEDWPRAQLDSLARGCAAICRARGWDPRTAVAGHKEYAKGRKTDPDGIDMDAFRTAVERINEEDGVSYDDVVRALRDVLHLPAAGLAVPYGQSHNGDLAAILVGQGQLEVRRDNAEAAQTRALAARLDQALTAIGGLPDAVAAKLPAGPLGQLTRQDVLEASKQAVRDVLGSVNDSPGGVA